MYLVIRLTLAHSNLMTLSQSTYHSLTCTQGGRGKMCTYDVPLILTHSQLADHKVHPIHQLVLKAGEEKVDVLCDVQHILTHSFREVITKCMYIILTDLYSNWVRKKSMYLAMYSSFLRLSPIRYVYRTL